MIKVRAGRVLIIKGRCQHNMPYYATSVIPLLQNASQHELSALIDHALQAHGNANTCLSVLCFRDP